MIRFKLDEIPEQIGGFRNHLEKRRRHSPPGRWLPSFKVSFETQQEEETDQWVAFLTFRIFDGKGRFPCRDAGKNETISMLDPPDRFPAEAVAAAFAQECAQILRDQYKPWMLAWPTRDRV